jgi:hypothetical protein
VSDRLAVYARQISWSRAAEKKATMSRNAFEEVATAI